MDVVCAFDLLAQHHMLRVTIKHIQLMCLGGGIVVGLPPETASTCAARAGEPEHVLLYTCVFGARPSHRVVIGVVCCGCVAWVV